ncbi:DUF262 domain-containing protein [Corynebacterium falsenii]|uniref:DUF262 domain-containing protein n=1 Tax=Corynebacterium falsenii TaxID=108486 RepID=UPI003FD39498
MDTETLNSSNGNNEFKLTGSPKRIQDCFRNYLYEVPKFQRPYSWTIDNLEDYWRDVIESKNDYFLGATVTWDMGREAEFRNKLGIIDGQQRLTTSVLLLIAVRDTLGDLSNEVNSDEMAEKLKTLKGRVNRYIVESDDDDNDYEILNRPEKYFRENMQKPGSVTSKPAMSESVENLQRGLAFFKDKITATIRGLETDQKLDQLRQIRDRALRAQVIQIELGSEEDGFLVFETLNSRGQDLQLSDLVKTLIIRQGAHNELDRSSLSARWQRLVDTFYDCSFGERDSLDRFIWQSWNSRREAEKETNLYKVMNQSLGGRSAEYQRLLDEFEVDMEIYRHFGDQYARAEKAVGKNRSAFAIPEVVDSIRALAIFNVSVANSAILALVRKYEQTALVKRGDIISVLQRIENFHFQFNTLIASSSTGGTRTRYNAFARAIEEASTKSEIRDAIERLTSQLEASLAPKKELAEAKFKELFYAPKHKLPQRLKNRGRRPLIAYVLAKIDIYNKRITANQDLQSWTIEHLKPQSQASDRVDDPVFSIGNLFLLTSGTNGDLADMELVDKCKILESRKLGDKFTEEWSKRPAGSSLSDDDIENRRDFLAHHAINSVWKIR